MHAAREPSATYKQQEALRTSTQVMLQADDFPWLQSRLAAMCMVGKLHLEPTKLTHYACGEYFRAHVDCNDGQEKKEWFKALREACDTGELTDATRARLLDPAGALSISNRFCTAFLYLNDVADGGKTTFTQLNADPAFYGHLAAVEALRGRSPLELPPRAELSGQFRAQREAGRLTIKPRMGMVVVHFPSTIPEYGCLLDRHAPRWHKSAPARASGLRGRGKIMPLEERPTAPLVTQEHETRGRGGGATQIHRAAVHQLVRR